MKNKKRVDCFKCDGRGYLYTYQGTTGYNMKTSCPVCKGSGKVSAGTRFIQKIVWERNLPF